MTVSPVTVEATSLSSVTEIAANPPRHPYTQPGTNAIPLTLYIARVPGSLDVFLTPHKPREKVVSAEDVLAALYFVHVNSATDTEMATSAMHTAGETGTGVPANHRDLPTRKPPLPKRSQHGNSFNRPSLAVQNEWTQTSAVQQQSHANGFDGIARKPLQRPQSDRACLPTLLDITNVSRSRQEGEVDNGVLLPSIQRRPLPMPPSESMYSESVHSNNRSLLKERSHQEDINPYFRRYDSVAAGNPYGSDSCEWSANGSQFAPKITIDRQAVLDPPSNSGDKSSQASPVQPPGSLTLIRRDPASGDQWNVASIYDPPVREISSVALLDPPTAGRRVKKGGAPLYLDITNQSYLQFEDQGKRADSQSSSLPTSNGGVSRPSFSSDSSFNPPDGVFRRRLYMPGSQNGDHTYGQTKHLSIDSAMGEDAMRKTMRQRASVDLSGPRVDIRSRAYSFRSPWDGKCEFTTGVSGKSLKCRHTLPIHNDVETLSELRFNLPTSSRSTPVASRAAENRSSYFSHSRHQSHDGSYRSGNLTPTSLHFDDGRLDLSLGQERAGGGFGGKQAKLGKLIIEPEGLKMLDLLVAANLGLWWRAYEKA